MVIRPTKANTGLTPSPEVNVDRNLYAVVATTGYINPPVAAADLVSYTVPAGRILKINQIVVWYSEPLLAMCKSIHWCITRGISRLPDTGGYFPVGDLNNPLSIASIWAGANEKVAILITPNASWDIDVTLVGFLGGRLYMRQPGGSY